MLSDPIYLLLDAARMEDEMDVARQLNPNFDSLYRGQSEESLSLVAPYLFRYKRSEEFEKWYYDRGWGDSWGVIVFSVEDMKTLVKHFRQFLMVKTEDGQELYFRFYDPRVLRIFLPTCDQKQLVDFFGPVEYFICESENPEEAGLFSLQNGLLNVERMSRQQAEQFEPVLKKKSFFKW